MFVYSLCVPKPMIYKPTLFDMKNDKYWIQSYCNSRNDSENFSLFIRSNLKKTSHSSIRGTENCSSVHFRVQFNVYWKMRFVRCIPFSWLRRYVTLRACLSATLVVAKPSLGPHLGDLPFQGLALVLQKLGLRLDTRRSFQKREGCRRSHWPGLSWSGRDQVSLAWVCLCCATVQVRHLLRHLINALGTKWTLGGQECQKNLMLWHICWKRRVPRTK